VENKNEESRFNFDDDFTLLPNGKNMTDEEVKKAVAERNKIMSDIMNGVYDTEEEENVVVKQA